MHKVIVNNLVYPVYQINGQRISGPPENLVYDEPPYENELYVTNLPRGVFEDTLLPIFSACGIVYKLRLMMCFSGTNRGFLYVLFATRQAAELALLCFARFPLYNRLIFAHKSNNKRVLLMGNISPTADVNEIIKFCYEDTKAAVVFPITDRNHKVKVLLFHYKSHYDAAMARRVLMTRLFDFGSKCYVKWHVHK